MNRPANGSDFSKAAPTTVRDDAAVDDPAEFFGQWRDAEPLRYDDDWSGWVVTGYPEAVEVLMSPSYSAKRLPRLAGDDPASRRVLHLLERWIVFMDPPDHRRLRTLMASAFTPRAIEVLRPTMRRLAIAAAEALPSGTSTDVISKFAFPFPAHVIAAMLDVPDSEISKFGTLSDAVATLIHAGDRPTATTVRSFLDLEDFLRRHIEAKSSDLGNDILSNLIRARDDEDRLDQDELVASCILLLFAGHETTKNLIGNMLFLLAQRPDLWSFLRDNRSALPTAVEEFLRFEGPAKATVRIVGDSTTVLSGKALRPGERVLVVLASANRDPRKFSEPNQFDPVRAPNSHLGFGVGIHYCLGAALVRAEAAIALEAIFDRFSSLEVSSAAPRWQRRLLNRGLEELHICGAAA